MFLRYSQFLCLFLAAPARTRAQQLAGAVVLLGLLLGPGRAPAYGQRIAAGNSFTVTVRADGSLWAWGWNRKGEVGDGTTTLRPTPVQLGTATNWQSVASCDYHTLAIRTDGTLWGWGDNGAGQLGLGNNTDQLVPVRVGTARWRSVAAGPFHTVGVRTDGTLWAWGQNYAGQLGDGTTTSQTSPLQIGTDTTWRSATAQEQQTLALRRSGTLWAWGDNFFGQLGLGTLASPKQLTPRQVGTDAWQSVSTCYHHTAAVRTDGTLWTWGQNYAGQLGDGTTYGSSVPHQIGAATTWRSATAGHDWTLATQADGSLWGWGLNTGGQLGNGTTTSPLVPTRSGTTASWQAVVAGGGHTVAVQANGSLWAWGSGGSGQLGSSALILDGQFAPIPLPTPPTWQSIAVGTSYMVGLRPDGTLWAWGNGLYGRLGLGTTATQYLPTQVGTAAWQSIAAGDEHSLAVRADGTLWGWGYNSLGVLGDPGTAATFVLQPVQIGPATTWRRVGTSTGHSAFVRADNSAWVCGSNRLGQLGTPSDSYTPLLILTEGSPLAGRPSTTPAWQPFPNPAHDQVQLPGAASGTAWQLFDTQGRLVRAGTGRYLPLQELPAGLYLLQASEVGQRPRTTRLQVE